MASFGILANKDRLEAEIAEAKKSVTKQKRIDRELSRVASGGRASSFLRKEAEKDEVLAASVALAATTDPLSMGNALINYQNAINPVNISDDLKTEDVPAPKIPEEGGGGEVAPPPPCPLGLYEKDGDVYVSSGTIAGKLPPSFDPIEGKFIASSGSGSLYAEIEIDGDTGEIESVDVKKGTTPSNTNTRFFVSLGAYQYDQDNRVQISNFRCGSVSISLCRNWFVGEPPYFTANIS